VSASAYERCPLKRGRKYSNLIEVWPGPKNGVRLREVSAYKRCPQGEVRLYLSYGARVRANYFGAVPLSQNLRSYEQFYFILFCDHLSYR
jgi:hypothetical protein